MIEMIEDTFKHFLHLPRFVSKSGEKPSLSARLSFIVIGVFLVAMLGNAVLSASLEGVIYPGVSVGGHDLSWKTRAQALSILKADPPHQKLTVKVGDKQFEADNKTLGVAYDLNKSVDIAYGQGRARNSLPILNLAKPTSSVQLSYSYSIDTAAFNAFVDKVVKSIGTDPVNASLSIDDKGVIQTHEPKAGYRISTDLLNNAITSSVMSARDQVIALDPVITQADIQPADTIDAQTQAKKYMQKQITLTYQDKSFKPDGATIGHWVVFNEQKDERGEAKLVASIDKKQIEGYVQSVANEVNVAPINKKVTVKNGVTQVDREGTDGSAIDQAGVSTMLNNTMSDDQPFSYTLVTAPVPFKTESSTVVTLDLGRYIEVNLSKQHLWVYQDHNVIYESPLTSGATGAGFPTVTGLFSIYYKNTNTYLNGRIYGYNYNVHVNYWMPFYQGYGLHDAYWRNGNFGGPDYYYGGSHGCVNLPDATAAFIYGWADVGTPVWVHL